jgi:hypothetical protein
MCTPIVLTPPLLPGEGLLFALGGVNGEPGVDGIVSSVEALDLGLGEWSTVSPMLTPRKNFAAAVANDNLYALGGIYTDYLAAVESYSPTTGLWTSMASMGTPRAYLAAVVADGRLYALGGLDNMVTAQSSVEALDLVTGGSWATINPMSTARYGLAGAASNGHLYAVAGYNHGFLNSVEALDLHVGTWAPVAPLLSPRIGLTAAVLNGHLFALGGYNVDSGSGVQLPTMESLDLSTASHCDDDDASLRIATTTASAPTGSHRHTHLTIISFTNV